jgi:hypothetical protein
VGSCVESDTQLSCNHKYQHRPAAAHLAALTAASRRGRRLPPARATSLRGCAKRGQIGGTGVRRGDGGCCGCRCRCGGLGAGSIQLGLSMQWIRHNKRWAGLPLAR